MMIDEELKKVVVEDGRILSYHVERGDLALVFRDYKEQLWHIVFEDVAALESYGCEGDDLCHVRTGPDEGFLQRARDLTQEDDLEQYTCVTFVSAWTSAPAMRILSQACRVLRH